MPELPMTKAARDAVNRILSSLEAGARGVQESFDSPDDDWMPVWMVMGQDRRCELLASPDELHLANEQVAHYARAVGAIAIGHVASSWQVDTRRMSADRARRVRAQMDSQLGSTLGIPERFECLLVAVYTASAYRVHFMRIERSILAPPTLGELELLASSATDGGGLSGGMVEPLQEALIQIG